MKLFKNIKLFKKKLSLFFLLLASLFVLTSTNKDFANFNVKAATGEKRIKLLKESKQTIYDFVLNLVKAGLTDEKIIDIYYDEEDEVKITLIENEYFKIKEEEAKKLKEKEANKEKKNETNKNETKKDDVTKEQKKRVENILKKIKEKETEIVKDCIDPPKKENKDKPIVIVNPGFGFNEPGFIIPNPKYKKTKKKKREKLNLREINISTFENVEEIRENFKEIPGKLFNQLLAYELVLKLLKENYEVYLVYDFVDLAKSLNLKLPKKNPSLHILFDTRPPIKGYGNPSPCRVADADAFCISEIFKYLTEHFNKKYKKDPKMCSICIHHDITSNKKAKLHGFVPYYRKTDRITSATLSKNSKKFAEIMLDCCKDVNKIEEGQDISQVKTEEWVVCGPGKEVKNAAAIFLEVGHVEHPKELKMLLNPKKRKQMTQAIEKAIAKYFKIDKK